MPWGVLISPGHFCPSRLGAAMQELLRAGMHQTLLRTKEIPWRCRGKTGCAGSLFLAPLSLHLRPWSQACDLLGSSLVKGCSGTLWLRWGDCGPAFPLLPRAPQGDA